MRFKEKTILIVGASSGIGYALANLIIREGGKVISASRSKPEELNFESHHEFDVMKEEDIESLAEKLPDTLDGLVYCPGSIKLRPFVRIRRKDFTNDYELNALGAAMVLQKAHKALKKSGGASVVLFSTVAVGSGMNFHASIAMAKGAVEGLGRSLAAEWASDKIRVNLISPSLTDTPLAKSLLSSDTKREASAGRHPLKRIGTPADQAGAAAFLLSDEASWITGQNIGIDGGLSALRPL